MKKVLLSILVILGLGLSLYLIATTYPDLTRASDQAADHLPILLTLMSICAFTFGVFLEYKGLNQLIKGNIHLHPTLLVTTAVLMVFVFIPATNWINWFSVDHPLYLQVLIIPETHMLLAVLAGTLFVRSFTKIKSS